MCYNFGYFPDGLSRFDVKEVLHMKKITILLISVLLLLSLAACSSAQDKMPMEITLPASLFEGLSESEIQADAVEHGYESCTVNQDGSVTYVMTGAKHRAALEDYREQIDEKIVELFHSEERHDAFHDIEHNEDFTQLDILVNLEEYTEDDNVHALDFYRLCAFYQAFSGIAYTDIDVVIHFRDPITRLTLSRISYRESLQDGSIDEEFHINENAGKVIITLPSELFETMSPEEIRADAASRGYEGCEVHDDGSVTYTMSKRHHDGALADLKASMDSMITDLLYGEHHAESFRHIVYNDDMSEVSIFVSRSRYSDWDHTYASGFQTTGAFYQAFLGIPAEEIDVTVLFYDTETEELLHTVSYRDATGGTATDDNT